MTLSQALVDSEQGSWGEERPETPQSGNEVCVCGGCGKVGEEETVGVIVCPR